MREQDMGELVSVEIVRELLVPPPIREVVIRLSYENAKLLQKLVGMVGGGVDSTAGFIPLTLSVYRDTSPVTQRDVRRLANQLWNRLQSVPL